MRILWCTWKDRQHPLAGGAEVGNEEIAKRLVRDGHEVIFLVGGFAGGKPEETRDGFRIIRVGGRVSVYWKAYQYYKKHLHGWADQVIDEINTIPFFAGFYAKEPVTLFIHQLAREIWFYEMIFPLSLVGYLAEPIYLWMLRNHRVITVSESTKKDLQRFGFTAKDIHIISEGIEMEPASDLAHLHKAPSPTMLALGTMRSMKRTTHIIRAFEVAKQQLPDLKLIIAGFAEGKYGKKAITMMQESPNAKDITYLGPVSKEKKKELLQTSHVLCVTSVKEGWGLVVTEANSQGTPAIVYNVDGLRDSVKNGETGIVCMKNTPKALGASIATLLKDTQTYERLRANAWEWSKQNKFERSYNEFLANL